MITPPRSFSYFLPNLPPRTASHPLLSHQFPQQSSYWSLSLASTSTVSDIPTFFYSTCVPCPVPSLHGLENSQTTMPLGSGSDLGCTNEKLLQEIWKAEERERPLFWWWWWLSVVPVVSLLHCLDTTSCTCNGWRGRSFLTSVWIATTGLWPWNQGWGGAHFSSSLLNDFYKYLIPHIKSLSAQNT